jgi:outer membrane murein-binding lipoprotein Lpp
VEEYQKLKSMVEEIAEDVYKAMGGNKAAGTRVRKAMQDIKNTAQEVRKRVLDIRDAENAPPSPGA